MAHVHTSKRKARRSTSASNASSDVEGGAKKSWADCEEETVPDSEGEGCTAEEGSVEGHAKAKRKTRTSLSSVEKHPKEKTRIVISDSDASGPEDDSVEDESDFTAESSSEDTDGESEDEELSEEDTVVTKKTTKKTIERPGKSVQKKVRETNASPGPPRKKANVGQSGKATAAAATSAAPARKACSPPKAKGSQKVKAQPQIRGAPSKHTLPSSTAPAPKPISPPQAPSHAPSSSTVPLWKRRMVPGLVRRKTMDSGKPLPVPASLKRMVPGLSAPKLG